MLHCARILFSPRVETKRHALLFFPDWLHKPLLVAFHGFESVISELADDWAGAMSTQQCSPIASAFLVPEHESFASLTF